MIKLIDLLNENNNIPGLEVVRDWVVDDYNSSIGYNPDVNISALLKILEPYKKTGKIYRVLSIPKNIENIKEYILKNKTDRYASFSSYLSGVKYYLPYTTGHPDERSVIISQRSEYYGLEDWYRDNFNELDNLYETNPDEYWWIDLNLPEIENTGEVIAKLSDNIEIEKIY
jgi:hypothetical protein